MSVFLQAESTLDNWIDAKSYETGQVVQFNKICQQSEATIGFNTGTGEMTFLLPGVYKIDWWLNIQAVSIVSIPIVMALISSQGDTIIGNSIQRQGTVSGSAVITIHTPGTTVSLVNQEVKITLSGVPVIAGLTVCSVGGSNLGYEMELTGSPNYECRHDEGIRFNQTILADNPAIAYHQSAGAFTLSQSGTYLVHWWLAPGMHNAADNLSFDVQIAVMVNGIPCAPTPFKSSAGMLTWTGTAYVRVPEEPTVLSLANISTGSILLSEDARQGRILITQLS